MSMRVLVISCVVVAAACAPPLPPRKRIQPFAGTLPKEVELDMAGVFTFSIDGELQLALVQPCVVKVDTTSITCIRRRLEKIQVVAHTPWGQDVRGAWSDAAHITFRADWKATGIDPLAADALALVVRPWDISGTQWNPSFADGRAILRLIDDATKKLVQGGPPSKLEVTLFAIEGNTLRAGHPSTLVVRIANRGSGIAYPVIATTRSSIEALHGQRLSFGMVKPGADEVRKLPLRIPVSETARDAMLVLELSEGNGAATRVVSHRIPIEAAAPKLAVRCAIVGRKVAQPDLDAGQRLPLSCTVDNTGEIEAKQVELEVSVAASAPVRSASQAIAVSGRRTFDMSITVPRTLPIGAPVEIAITARDRPSLRTAQTTIVGVVRKPKLCVRGQLTREQYRAKVNELGAAVTAGDITQEQFDRYDAELVNCLK